MNVRIFWVRAMKCMCAQTRPRFILSSKRVFWGMEFEPMLTPREKSPLPENFPRGGSNPQRCGQWAQTLPTSYSGPHAKSKKIFLLKATLVYKPQGGTWKEKVAACSPEVTVLIVVAKFSRSDQWGWAIAVRSERLLLKVWKTNVRIHDWGMFLYTGKWCLYLTLSNKNSLRSIYTTSYTSKSNPLTLPCFLSIFTSVFCFINCHWDHLLESLSVDVYVFLCICVCLFSLFFVCGYLYTSSCVFACLCII